MSNAASTPDAVSSPLRLLLTQAPVIPVLVIDDLSVAQSLAEALVRGGLPVLEVTLRTPAALEVIRAMAQVPGAHIGAGTVLNPQQYDQAMAAGARFVVAPGLTPALLKHSLTVPVPLLPGAVTASEVMQARDSGLRELKFFPAESMGGASTLKAFAAVFPEVAFCPTGGITASNLSSYLALSNVVCVGGSWLTPRELLATRNFAEIENLARQACALAGQ